MHTDEFRILVKRLRQLRRQFLPRIDPTGAYSETEYDQVRALQLLAHAEVEGYLEDVGRSVVAACTSKYYADSAPRSLLISLVAYHSAPADREPVNQLESVVRNRVTQYFHAVSGNNGLKEKNCDLLLRPLGLNEQHFPPGFMALMDAFGAARGRIAHTGVGAQSPPDPADARDLLSRVVWALRSIDRELVRLRDE